MSKLRKHLCASGLLSTIRQSFLRGTRQLNEKQFDCEVNFLEYWKTRPNGKISHGSWVTDIPLNLDTVEIVMQGGRARWRIEVENKIPLQGEVT